MAPMNDPIADLGSVIKAHAKYSIDGAYFGGELPLHSNASETDIREYVTRRKISGTTGSEAGR